MSETTLDHLTGPTTSPPSAGCPDTPSLCAALVRLLSRTRVDLASEKVMQSGIGVALASAGIPFERERRLSTEDIPDFLIPTPGVHTPCLRAPTQWIAVECKLKGRGVGPRKIDIYRQIERYARHPEVAAIILASNLSMGLPAEIRGKPVYAASLSKGWLL